MSADPSGLRFALNSPGRPRLRSAPDVASVLAIEVGGTTTRLARFDVRTNTVSSIMRVPTPNYLVHPDWPANRILTALFQRVRAAAEALLGKEVPTVVVMAWPGPVTPGGIALRSPTILGEALDRPDNIREILCASWPESRVHILNDLTGAGYYYLDRGYRDFCVITVGSGIGNKVFLDGKPQIGPAGLGGEIGHLRMSPEPGTPVAGVQRELGSIASGRGTLWLSQMWDCGPLSADAEQMPFSVLEDRESLWNASKALVSAFRGGDLRARSVVRAAAYPLALAMGGLHLALGITHFFIVGGFAKALGSDYRALLSGWCRDLTWTVGPDWDDMIELGAHDIEEGLIGAACFATQNTSAIFQESAT